MCISNYLRGFGDKRSWYCGVCLHYASSRAVNKPFLEAVEEANRNQQKKSLVVVYSVKNCSFDNNRLTFNLGYVAKIFVDPSGHYNLR